MPKIQNSINIYPWIWEKKYALNLSLVGPLLDMQVHGVYTCIYVHMHRCATMVIVIMINPAILLWSSTYYFSSHLINMLNPIYIYVRSITWVTWQLYSLGVDMYMYTLMPHGKRIWMPKRQWWRHFQHAAYFGILYILFSILSSQFTLFYYILILPNGKYNMYIYMCMHIYMYVCIHIYICMYVYIYIGKHGKDNCDVTK